MMAENLASQLTGVRASVRVLSLTQTEFMNIFDFGGFAGGAIRGDGVLLLARILSRLVGHAWLSACRFLNQAHQGEINIAGLHSFAEVPVCTSFPSLLHHAVVESYAGKDKDWDIRLVLSDDRNDFQAVNFRHENIEDDSIAGIRLNPRINFSWIQYHRALMFHPVQVILQGFQQQKVIVNDEKIHGFS